VIRLADVELLGYRHELDMRFATVNRHLSFRDHEGRETTLHSRRFVSMADAHHGGIEWTLVRRNWSGRVEVVTAIDGRVSNAGVARYQQLEGRHLSPVGPRTLGPEVIALKTETRQSNLYVSYAARTRVFLGDGSVQSSGGSTRWKTTSSRSWASTCARARRRGVEKLVTFLHVAGPGGQRHAGEGGHVGGAAHPISARRSSGTPRRGRSCGGCATCGCPEMRVSSCCCGCTSGTSCRSAHGTPPTSTRDCRPRPERRGLSRARVLG